MAPTYFLGHLFGLLLLIVSIALLARKKDSLAAIYELVESKALLFVLGFISLFVGLFVVLIHNVWDGSLLALIVTLIGWAMVLRGIILLGFPQAFRRIFRAFHIETAYYTIALIAFILGAYMTYLTHVGWY